MYEFLSFDVIFENSITIYVCLIHNALSDLVSSHFQLFTKTSVKAVSIRFDVADPITKSLTPLRFGVNLALTSNEEIPKFA
eukprot:9340452-Heterocapsa_arctica.AAC.1